MDPAIPWYKSSIVVGLVVSLVLKGLVISGLVGSIAPGLETQLTEAILLVLSGGGDLWALRGRLVQTAAPVVTATAGKAARLTAEAEPVEGLAVPMGDAEQGHAIVQVPGFELRDNGDAFYGFGGQVEATQRENG